VIPLVRGVRAIWLRIRSGLGRGLVGGPSGILSAIESLAC
jgi:hypothetical protein